MPWAKWQPKIAKFLPPETLVRWIFEAACLQLHPNVMKPNFGKPSESGVRSSPGNTYAALPAWERGGMFVCGRRLLYREAFVLRGLRISLIATCFATECGCGGSVYTHGFAVSLEGRTVNPPAQKGGGGGKKTACMVWMLMGLLCSKYSRVFKVLV